MRNFIKENVNVKKEDKKLKEAELLNQQTPAEEVPAPQPAAPEEVAAAQQEVAAPAPQPAAEEAPVEEVPQEEEPKVEIPATVEIKTTDLSQAIAQATGDVEPAEMGVDMQAKQAQEQVSQEPLVQEPEMPVEQPMTEAIVNETEAAEACAQAKPEGERKVEDPESEPIGVKKSDYDVAENKSGVEKSSLVGEDPFKESLSEEEKNLILEFRKYKEAAESAPETGDIEQPSASASKEVIGVVEAPKVEDISSIDDPACEACAAAEAAAPVKESAEPKGKTVDGAINAEGYQPEKLDESVEKFAIYCTDPDNEATGYVGSDMNWKTIDDLMENEPHPEDCFYNSKEEAEEVINSDPLFKMYMEGGARFEVKPVGMPAPVEEEVPVDGWSGLKAWIDAMKKEIEVGEGPNGNALTLYKRLRPIVAMKNVKRLDDLYYNMYDEIEDMGGKDIGIIADIESILNEAHPANFAESKMKEAIEDEMIEEAPVDLISDGPAPTDPMPTDIPAFGEEEAEEEEVSLGNEAVDGDIDSFASDDDIDLADYDPNEAADIDAMLQSVEDEASDKINTAKSEVAETADKLQNSADFLKSLADNGEEFMGDVEEEPIADDFEECVERIPVNFPKKKMMMESIEDEEPLVVDESAIVFPAGSREEAPVEEENLVQAYEARVRAKREAIAEFRESIRRKNEAESERFNEALKGSVKKEESRVNENSNSWASNRFYEKYEEKQKLDFKSLKAMLQNGLLG